jgi:hypothetical protein
MATPADETVPGLYVMAASTCNIAAPVVGAIQPITAIRRRPRHANVAITLLHAVAVEAVIAVRIGQAIGILLNVVAAQLAARTARAEDTFFTT